MKSINGIPGTNIYSEHSSYNSRGIFFYRIEKETWPGTEPVSLTKLQVHTKLHITKAAAATAIMSSLLLRTWVLIMRVNLNPTFNEHTNYR